MSLYYWRPTRDKLAPNAVISLETFRSAKVFVEVVVPNKMDEGYLRAVEAVLEGDCRKTVIDTSSDDTVAPRARQFGPPPRQR